MKVAAISLLMLAAETEAVDQTKAPESVPTSKGHVIDWDSMPALPYRAAPVVTAAMHDWVRKQVNRRHCRARKLVDGRPAVRLQIAVLVDQNNNVRTTVPTSIGCPVVEQYTAGLVAGFSRNNLLQRAANGASWYRTTVTFFWAK